MSILSARSRAGYSQAKLARAVGVSDAAVCQWETGKQLPRASLLPKIATVLNCTIDELLDGNCDVKTDAQITSKEILNISDVPTN